MNSVVWGLVVVLQISLVASSVPLFPLHKMNVGKAAPIQPEGVCEKPLGLSLHPMAGLLKESSVEPP